MKEELTTTYADMLRFSWKIFNYSTQHPSCCVNYFNNCAFFVGGSNTAACNPCQSLERVVSRSISRSIVNLRQIDDEEEFSGIVPLDKINITYSKSSGAGGQNVNKVNTKVEMRFHVESAEWIPEWIRQEILKKESSKITKEGYLIIRSEASRTQKTNQEDCIDKIKALISSNSEKPYQPTAKELQIKEKRIQKAKEKVVQQKKQKSQKKFNRQKPSFGD